ncbi:MAG: hypothetical protein WB763_26040 [Terriglobia bacterium]|jgi:hypothetical protein
MTELIEGHRQHLLWLQWPTGDEDASSFETWLGKKEKAGPHGHGGGDRFGDFIECV